MNKFCQRRKKLKKIPVKENSVGKDSVGVMARHRAEEDQKHGLTGEGSYAG